MARVLVVKNPFGGRDRGDRITDADEIEKILAGEHAHHVLQADHAAITDGREITIKPPAPVAE